MYIASKDYYAKKADELTLRKGDFVYVIEKNLNGWWKTRFDYHLI